MKPTYDNCQRCGAEIDETRRRLHAKFCTNSCRARHHQDNYKKKNHVMAKGIPSSTMGAIGEYIVSVDLMARGMSVFKAASPASSCDLVILSGNVAVRFEVRTGHRSATGKILYPHPDRDAGRLDYYAVVLHSEPAGILYLDPDGNQVKIDAVLDGLRTLAAGYRQAGG